MGNPVEIKKNIYSVGVKDWNVRDFHGYTTSRGSTYNAYLIVDEKITLVDTVKNRFSSRLLENISKIVDPAKIDYLISNHTEPDHSSSTPHVMAAAPGATIIATAAGKSGLERYYGGSDWKINVVKTGDALNIGSRTLSFVATPMAHWPDSMVTYSPSDKLLFSMDIFGQHFASSGCFDDEVPYDELMREAKKYYANIIMHLGKIVKKTLPAVEQLDIDMVAPAHGLILRKHIPDFVASYKDWADCKPTPKVLVIYDTMWMSTEQMAKAILEGATRPGVDARLIKLSVNDLTEIMTEVLDAGALAVGSPTLNNNILPTCAAFCAYLRGLKPTNKIGAAFGSHGWAGGGAKQVDEELEKTGIARVREPLTCVYKPDAATLEECRKLGAELADKVEQYK